jgi:uncharacterized protein (TIRG00374 family)
LKKFILPVVKAAVAISLVYWLIHTGKITLEPFVRLLGTPWLIPFIFGINLLGVLINNYRWLLLLRGQRIISSMKQTVPLTFIGLFFNLAMPGSVGGDVIKAYFIAKDQPGTKLGAATSVLMDRVVGMYAMALIALASVLSNFSRIMMVHQLQALAIFIVSLVAGFTVFFLVGFSNTVRSHVLTHKILKSVPGGRIIEKIYDAVHAFRHGKRQFLLGILLSVIVQLTNICSLYILAKFLNYHSVDFAGFLFVIPIGLIATAVPISPAGIGVGQAVFLALFTWYQGVQSDIGPTLITITQVAQASLGLIGAVFYLLRKTPKQDAAK